MNEIKIDKNLKPNEALDKFTNVMADMAINGINEAVANERAKTAYWMRQAYILKSKLGKCRDCSNPREKKELDVHFHEVGGSDCDNYNCENKKNTDFIKQYEPRN